MTTEHVIKTIATSMGLTYSLGTLFQLNKALDKIVRKKEYPVCLQVQTTDGSFSSEVTQYYDRIHETQRIRLIFGDAIKLDYEPEQILGKVDALKKHGIKMIDNLNQTGLFDTVTNVTYSIMYDRFDANLVAALFEFDLTEAEGICIDEMDEGAFNHSFNISFNRKRL